MNVRKPNVVNTYLRHKDINDYLECIRRRYHNIVTVVNIGKSFEGRQIKGIKIDINKNRKQCNAIKNWILIEAGTHAREWISISVALYCIHQLTEKNFRHKELLKKASFFIIPLVNADGYEYTHNKNRSWRKNRRPIPNCRFVGTDCNRNYDIHWEHGTTKCSRSTYRGDNPFSEAETCALRNVMQSMRPQIKLLLSLHSYAQSIMYPWGYKKELPETWECLQSLADAGRVAIQKATGREYKSGSISTLRKRTYPGSLADYAFAVEKIPFVIVMELPCSKYKFHPPPQQIGSITAESWTGIKAMCEHAMLQCKQLKE